MTNMFCTSAPTGLPSGPAVALPAWGSARLRAPEAFTTPYQGTGLPFGGTVTGADAFGRTPAVVDVVTREVDAPNQVEHDVITHDGTTLGIHSSTRPPS